MDGISEWPFPIHVIGLGGIGCQIVQRLIELDVPRMTLWDDDTVDGHNIPSQVLYRRSDIGRMKVDAAYDYLRRQEYEGEVAVRPHRANAEDRSALGGLVISGVDSMASRSSIWQALKFNPAVYCYFDARVGGDEYQLHSLNPNNLGRITAYESWLFPDSDANDLGCATREQPYSAVAVTAELSAKLPLVIEGEPVANFLNRKFSREITVRQPAGM